MAIELMLLNSLKGFLKRPTDGKHKFIYNGIEIEVTYYKNENLIIVSYSYETLMELVPSFNKLMGEGPIAEYLKDVDPDEPYVRGIEWNYNPERRIEEILADPTIKFPCIKFDRGSSKVYKPAA